MDDVVQFAGVMAVVVTSVVGLIAGVRWAFGGFGRRDGAGRNEELVELRARVAQLERSVDVVAVEVERVGEAQRFTERVLAGGGQGTAPVTAPADAARR